MLDSFLPCPPFYDTILPLSPGRVAAADKADRAARMSARSAPGTPRGRVANEVKAAFDYGDSTIGNRGGSMHAVDSQQETTRLQAFADRKWQTLLEGASALAQTIAAQNAARADSAAQLEAAARHSGQPDALVQAYVAGVHALLARGNGSLGDNSGDGERPAHRLIKPPSPPTAEAHAEALPARTGSEESAALTAVLDELLTHVSFVSSYFSQGG
jgi:hypothetical protein